MSIGGVDSGEDLANRLEQKRRRRLGITTPGVSRPGVTAPTGDDTGTSLADRLEKAHRQRRDDVSNQIQNHPPTMTRIHQEAKDTATPVHKVQENWVQRSLDAGKALLHGLDESVPASQEAARQLVHRTEAHFGLTPSAPQEAVMESPTAMQPTRHPWLRAQEQAGIAAGRVFVGQEVTPEEQQRGWDVMTNLVAPAGAPAVGAEALATQATAVGGAALRRAAGPVGREIGAAVQGFRETVGGGPRPAPTPTEALGAKPSGVVPPPSAPIPAAPAAPAEPPGGLAGTSPAVDRHTHEILNAVGSTPGRTFVEAKGRIFEVPQSDYGRFGRTVGSEIYVSPDGKTTIDASLVDRVVAEDGRTLWRRPAPSAPPAEAPRPAATQVGREAEDQAAQQDAGQAVKAAETAQAQAVVQGQQAQTSLGAMISSETPPTEIHTPLPQSLLQILNDERGSINLGAIDDVLQRNAQRSQLAGSLGDQLNGLKGSETADVLDMGKIMKAVETELTPDEVEQLVHSGELRSAEGLSPKLQSYHRVLEGIRDYVQEQKATLPRKWRPLGGIGYVRRFALDESTLFKRLRASMPKDQVAVIMDRIKRAVTPKDMSMLRGLLSTGSRSFKHREYYALTEEGTGSRILALHDRATDRITAVDGTELGTLKARYKTFQELKDSALRPIQNKLDNLAQQLRVFNGWGAFNKAYYQARSLPQLLNKLADDLGEQDAKLAGDLRLEARRATQEMSGGVGKRTIQRFESVKARVAKMQTALNKVEESFDPDTLENRVFVGADKKRYVMTPAYVREIEAQTNQRYFKNAVFSTMYDYFETQRLVRANAFLENFKMNPDIQKFAGPIEPSAKEAAAGIKSVYEHEHFNEGGKWRSPEGIPNFRGWLMDPVVAAQLERIMSKHVGGDSTLVWNSLMALNHGLVAVGFFNPLIHGPNMISNWAFDRGIRRWLPGKSWVNLAKSTTRALNAAAHFNSDYTDLLRMGSGGLMRGNSVAEVTRDALMDQTRLALQKDASPIEGLAAELGIGAARLANSPWWMAHHATWFINDALFMQRIFERELEGMSPEAAMREANRFIPNYQIPGTVLRMDALSRFMSNRGFVLFAPYHYGVLKALGQAAKDMIGPTVPLRQRLEAAEKLGVAAIGLTVVAPKLDQFWQHLTGDPKARAARPGVLKPLDVAYSAYKGRMPIDWAIQTEVTPSPMASVIMNTLQNRQRWASGAQSVEENIANLLHEVGANADPRFHKQWSQAMQQPDTPFGQRAVSAVESILTSPLVSHPKSTPEERGFADFVRDHDRLEYQVALLQLGGDYQGAWQKAHDYNERARRNASAMVRLKLGHDDVFEVSRIVRPHEIKLKTPWELNQMRQRQNVPSDFTRWIPQRGPRRTMPGPGP